MAGERELQLLGSTEVQQALRDVGARVATGLPGLVLCRGPGGFALVAGVVGKAAVGVVDGHMIALSLTIEGLDALIQRACELRVNPERGGAPAGAIIQ